MKAPPGAAQTGLNTQPPGGGFQIQASRFSDGFPSSQPFKDMVAWFCFFCQGPHCLIEILTENIDKHEFIQYNLGS
jgi:hypothetical protein